MSNKPGGLLGARRKSTPTSPTSPTFLRKLNRSQDVFVPPETTPNESPSVDLTVPSPTFDLASISPSLAPGNRFTQRPQSYNRASDDFGKSRPRFLAETTRPATSSAEGSAWNITQGRNHHSPEQAGSRESPSFGSTRMSSEGSGRSSSREKQDAVHTTPFRSTTFLSYHDRSASDDGPVVKGVASAKKSRFTALKSPRNLFARRRSSQNVSKLDDSIMNVSNLHVPAMPDNIETSIRGNIVHDWSRPRNRGSNIDSSPRADPPSTPSYPRRPSEAPPHPASSVGTPTSAHGPFFREHFQEEQRPLQPANTGYLHGQTLQPPPSGALPKFAQRLPLDLPSENEIPSSPLPGSVANYPELETTATLPPEPDMAPPPPPPSSSPPALPHTLLEEPPSPVLGLPPVDTLPKHMTSTSSRFSFIGQQGSIAQEKFLEEKHKEHASKKPAATRLSVTSIDGMDDYDYDDDMDDEDGFHNDDIVTKNIDVPSSQYAQEFTSTVEEDYGEDYGGEDYGYQEDDDDDEHDEFGTGHIPVRNVDMPTSLRANREDANVSNIKRQSLLAFHFTPQSLSFSPTTAEDTSTSTPRDLEGYVIGMAESKEGLMYNIQPQIRDSLDQSPEAKFYQGLGISTVADDTPGAIHVPPQSQPFDDMYFHDSEFDNDVADFNADFDEDMLDDAERIRDIPAENARKLEQASQRGLPHDQIKVASGGHNAKFLPETPQRVSLYAEQSNSNHRDMPTNNTNGLTEGNLAAYHDALAQAANQAAANGKFDRNVSFSRISDDETDSPFHNSIPALSSRGSKYSNNIVESGISDEDGFGFDDDLDDEAMIAAANAEALENDDDGFYGQEFGFFARAHGKDSAEFSSGGYFASRGSNGIKRSHSAKNNFQEPSLTPITERSEMSARNSMVSLQPYCLLGPGGSSTIAEMMGRDSPIVDDEMNLTTLFKLRSKTFGGSSTSINSLADRHHSHSSPLTHLSGHNSGLTDSFGGKLSSPVLGISGNSITESGDEDEEYGRPTLTQNTPHKKHVEPVPQSLYDHIPSSPLGRKGQHSRNSSGAESVSYAQDADGRWVLERTRKDDHGEIESVEREYYAGARI